MSEGDVHCTARTVLVLSLGPQQVAGYVGIVAGLVGTDGEGLAGAVVGIGRTVGHDVDARSACRIVGRGGAGHGSLGTGRVGVGRGVGLAGAHGDVARGQGRLVKRRGGAGHGSDDVVGQLYGHSAVRLLRMHVVTAGARGEAPYCYACNGIKETISFHCHISFLKIDVSCLEE